MTAYVHWYLRDLTTLLKDSRISVQIYVTRGSASELPSPAASGASSRSLEQITTNGGMFEKEISADIQSPVSNSSVDLEKTLPSETESTSPIDISSGINSVPVKYQRPDVGSIIRAAVDETDAQARVAVMGCGPNGLMNQVRNVTASCIRTDGPAVELHCEQFGW